MWLKGRIKREREVKEKRKTEIIDRKDDEMDKNKTKLIYKNVEEKHEQKG